MGLHAVGVANNHIMDHGASGLGSTLRACSGIKLAAFGAGPSLEQARRIEIKVIDGLRVGLLAMAEREWSIATGDGPGANPMDLIEFVRQMKEARRQLDFLVVLLHAGCEGYELPSPRLRQVCQFLVEEGANVVTCQHSHCVGAYETYLDQLIVYGQGNFIFDYESQGDKGREGILISLTASANKVEAFELLPFSQGGPKVGLVRMAPEAEMRFKQGLESRSLAMAQAGYVEACWEEYCQTRKLILLNEVLDHGRVLRRLNRNGAILRLRGKPYFKNLLSIVQNESMVETLNTLLRDMLK
jgi:poly-gamma-glutamate synthesis protein (capsule biosynthesis protein)